MFRLRTLSGSNIAGFLLGGAIYAQFFLLTLYLQQVLHYSAMQTGVAYVALTLAVIVFANVSQALELRVGIRRVLPAGLALVAAGLGPRGSSTRASRSAARSASPWRPRSRRGTRAATSTHIPMWRRTPAPR
jgi:hypothetical protein